MGVFKALYSQVSHYFCPAASDQSGAAAGSRPSNAKEVRYRRLCRRVVAASSRLTPRLGFAEEAAWTAGLPGQREAGAGPGPDLQVQGCGHQLLRQGRLQPRQRVQDLPAWFPWSALCC